MKAFSTNVMDTLNQSKPPNPDDYVTVHFGKVVRRNLGVPTIDHHNKWESIGNIKALFCNVVEVLYSGFARIYTIESGIVPNKKMPSYN